MSTKISGQLNNLANKWEVLSEKTPDVAAKATADIVRVGVKLVGPGAEAVGGMYVAGKSADNLAGIINGHDVPGFKASTSNTDAVLGGVVYGVAGMVGLGMTVHAALRAAAIIASSVEKND